ncbi:guanine nucleotide-binding protein subunit gamma [Octopus bimaculoides]|uniref:G protein gamma domain-containing protein n=1 Tax=Octopus bimaculoides TaxID=37653 RepID=A0A0L8FXH7_OCTBM|nr:guanine nucleotide-binding protein subunit gamma [Octopus bimaculoides]|eukprot:XP_014785977.1 PREDICTED: guanine nucleotide-binding protein subunit gamma-like [Octopus bimaculoides]
MNKLQGKKKDEEEEEREIPIETMHTIVKQHKDQLALQVMKVSESIKLHITAIEEKMPTDHMLKPQKPNPWVEDQSKGGGGCLLV